MAIIRIRWFHMEINWHPKTFTHQCIKPPRLGIRDAIIAARKRAYSKGALKSGESESMYRK